MTTDKIEVLAPAGNPAALKAAVFAGADAVYMGGALFSARANAANFSREEMREAAAFARERGVRVYVTVNTLVKDAELAEALDFCAYLCSLPVDGILVQDMGLFGCGTRVSRFKKKSGARANWMLRSGKMESGDAADFFIGCGKGNV